MRRQRKALYLTQRELARRVGCAMVTVKKIEADEGGNEHEVAICLERLARLSIVQEMPERAVQLWAAAERPREKLGVPLPTIERVEYKRQLSTVRAQLEPAAFTAAQASGRHMTSAEAVAYALDPMK